MKAIRVRFPVLAAAALAALGGTALAQDNGQRWNGIGEDSDHPYSKGGLMVGINYWSGNPPHLKIVGEGYNCVVKTFLPAVLGRNGVVSYPIASSSGGRCDTLLGGRLAVSETPDSLGLQVFTGKGEVRFQSILKPIR